RAVSGLTSGPSTRPASEIDGGNRGLAGPTSGAVAKFDDLAQSTNLFKAESIAGPKSSRSSRRRFGPAPGAIAGAPSGFSNVPGGGGSDGGASDGQTRPAPGFTSSNNNNPRPV